MFTVLGNLETFLSTGENVGIIFLKILPGALPRPTRANRQLSQDKPAENGRMRIYQPR